MDGMDSDAGLSRPTGMLQGRMLLGWMLLSRMLLDGAVLGSTLLVPLPQDFEPRDVHIDIDL